jgi:hypothetical protein
MVLFSKITSPLLGFNKEHNKLSNVDFPVPLAPIIAMDSVGNRSKLMVLNKG